MYLLDSNIIIYSINEEHRFLKQFLEDASYSYSEISYLEALGYSKITSKEQDYFYPIFLFMRNILGTKKIIEVATILRQQKKISLGDSIIAATALENKLTLVTRNIEDFSWIKNIKLHNPFTENDQH